MSCSFLQYAISTPKTDASSLTLDPLIDRWKTRCLTYARSLYLEFIQQNYVQTVALPEWPLIMGNAHSRLPPINRSPGWTHLSRNLPTRTFCHSSLTVNPWAIFRSHRLLGLSITRYAKGPKAAIHYFGIALRTAASSNWCDGPHLIHFNLAGGFPTKADLTKCQMPQITRAQPWR